MRPTDDELAALLAAERPASSPAFAAALDAWVADGCAGPRPGARPQRAPAGVAPGRLRRLLRRPATPALATALAGVVAVVVALNAGGGPAPAPQGRKAPASTGATAAAGAAPLPRAATLDALSARKVVQSSDLELSTSPDRIEDAAQEALRVVALYGGIVDHSTVTSGIGGGAQLQLRLQSGRLPQALAALSQLPHAHVVSRTDDATDVNQGYVSIRRRLADVRAERAGLLHALAAATSAQDAASVHARLAAVERTLAQLEARQRTLDRAIAYSRVTLAIGADAPIAHGSAFTPGRAWHDAGRLLAVTAGVVVIGAAALVPLAIVLACAWPLARALRRRRREQALDAA